MSQPWYREVSRQEWKTFLTTFAAWTLDAFDFTIITFVLLDIQNSFSVNKALADPKMRERLAQLGGAPIPGTPEDFGKVIAAETEKWAKVVASSGATVD